MVELPADPGELLRVEKMLLLKVDSDIEEGCLPRTKIVPRRLRRELMRRAIELGGRPVHIALLLPNLSRQR